MKSLKIKFDYLSGIIVIGCEFSECVLNSFFQGLKFVRLRYCFSSGLPIFKWVIKANPNLDSIRIVRDVSRNLPSTNNIQTKARKSTLIVEFFQEFPFITFEIQDPYLRERWTEGTWISQLRFKGIKNLRGEIPVLANKMWSEFSIDPASSIDHVWEGSFKESVLQITTLGIEGADPVKLTGVMASAPKKSHLILTYPKNKKWKPVRKDIPEFSW